MSVQISNIGVIDFFDKDLLFKRKSLIDNKNRTVSIQFKRFISALSCPKAQLKLTSL